MQSIFNFLASLRLTVAVLAASLVLVFAGTIAQVKLGLYIAQVQFFSSLFIYWGPEGAGWKIPVFPGGYLLGAILVINLIAAHIKRFSLSGKKAGIFIIHAGLIVLFLGQFATQLFQVESHMAIPEGESRNYSEAQRLAEVAIIDVSDPKTDKVVSIPEGALAHNQGKTLQHPELPFPVTVLEYHPNSNRKTEAGKTDLVPAKVVTAMDQRDMPMTRLSITDESGAKVERLLSYWNAEPTKFNYKGRQYLMTMRPKRYYKPFSISLIDFRFDKYLGTGMAKNYSSRVRIERPDTGENREVTIFMNNPLRYNGETYYQQGFFPDTEDGTILQVVRNPSWLTPYVACILVSLGLLVQFLGHLIGFAKKRPATT